MDFNEIRKMAKGMDINSYRLKKSDIIRAIQRAENNIECFGTQRVDYCNEDQCLWRHDCISLNNNAQSHRGQPLL
jgi:DNA-binding IscR family transcriptional regulator